MSKTTEMNIGVTLNEVTRYVSSIDSVYKGLGIPSLYGVLSVLANRSVFFIGSVEAGKDSTLKSIPELYKGNLGQTQEWQSITLLDFAIKLGSVQKTHLVIKILEYSMLSDQHRKNMITILSGIIPHGTFNRPLTIGKSQRQIGIIDCDLTLLIGIQPYWFTDLSSTPQFSNMANERYSKFLLVNPLKPKLPARIGTVDGLPKNITPFTAFNPTISNPSAIDPNELVKGLDLSKVEDLFGGQLTGTMRANEFATDYVIALARFLGDRKVTQNHVDLFYKLFFPYLEMFNRTQKFNPRSNTATIDESEIKLVELIANEEGLRPENYSTRYVRQRVIRGCTSQYIKDIASDLLKAKLIKSENIGRGRARGTYCRYYLEDEFHKYFDKYRKRGFPI